MYTLLVSVLDGTISFGVVSVGNVTGELAVMGEETLADVGTLKFCKLLEGLADSDVSVSLAVQRELSCLMKVCSFSWVIGAPKMRSAILRSSFLSK